MDYQQLDPVLDYETALDHPSVVHPEQDYFNNFPVGGDPQGNSSLHIVCLAPNPPPIRGLTTRTRLCGMPDPQRNLVASGERSGGDLERVFSECDVVVEETFHTKAVAQAMMETFRTYTWLDHNNRPPLPPATIATGSPTYRTRSSRIYRSYGLGSG